MRQLTNHISLIQSKSGLLRNELIRKGNLNKDQHEAVRESLVKIETILDNLLSGVSGFEGDSKEQGEGRH